MLEKPCLLLAAFFSKVNGEGELWGRLRGLDALEVDTPRGKKAKQLVEKALGGLETILLRTSTSDKYDRFLADIFYGKDGTFLNQQLLDERLAEVWKD